MTIFECLQREEFFYLNVFLKLLLYNLQNEA